MGRIRSYVLPNATLHDDTLFDIPSLLADPLLRACFQETLRLRAQNSATRMAIEDTTIPVNGKQHLIRKGTLVNIPALLIHLDPEIYSNVDEFQPERFLDTNLESALVDKTSDNEEGRVENKSPKFFKRGIPVKQYLMPFGGGENLVKIIMSFVLNEFSARAVVLLKMRFLSWVAHFCTYLSSIAWTVES